MPEYRTMAHTACEIIWLKNLLMELDFRQPGSMYMYCDNQQYAIYIAQNVFHERTKHRDAWTKKVATFCFTPSSMQLADLLIKAASSHHPRCLLSNLCNKLGMLDMFVPA